MINPLRSEEDAFRFTVVVAVLVAPVALSAILFGSGVGLAVAGGLAFGIFFALFVLKRDSGPERAVIRRGRRERGGHRVLVVANETLSGAALREEIEHRATGPDTEVFVVCPALNSKIGHWTSDDDRARAAAHARLREMLDALDREGFNAQGDIGDDDPIQAMEDALRLFGADEVIISTHPPGRSNWLERDVVGRARERFEVPVTHVVVDLERERGLGAREDEPASPPAT
jgi:GABA permease